MSFKSITTANEFIEVIEESNNRKDIKEEFLLGEVIGEGGFAKVKKAYNKTTKEICAVKIINKFQRNNSQKRMTCNDDIDNMKFIISEVDVCRILMNYTPKHDNIVCIYGIYETFCKVYLVMKYIPSGSLDFLIEKRFTSLSLNDKYFISSQLSSAVSFLHTLNIMHRDIKASNVLIDSNLKVYLIDFGLSHIISNDELTKGSYGTVSCAPPEIFRKDSYNKSIDVWSMGVVIYYIYYGAMPFSKKEQTVEDVIANILNLRLKLYKKESLNGEEKEKEKVLLRAIKRSLNRDINKRATSYEISQLF